MDEDNIDNKEVLNQISEIHKLVKDIDTRLIKLEETNDKIKEGKNNLLNKIYEYNADPSNNHIELPSKEKINEYLTDTNKQKNTGFFNVIKNIINQDANIDPSRLLGLSDGIFGMVLTLLAFGIGLPSVMLANSYQFETFVQSIIPSIGIVIISFVVIGNFWILHHQYLKIKNITVGFLWLNILYLACISFIPFTTSIIGTYGSYILANLLFGLNILLTLIIFHIIIQVGSANNYIENEVIEKKNYIKRTSAELIVLTIIIILLNSFVSVHFIYLFLLIPIINIISDYRIRNKNLK